jgi:hypothetical protein
MCRPDNLHAAAGGRLGTDNLTLHRRSILSQVERGTGWRRLTDSFARFSRECGGSECENSDRREENFLHDVYRLSCVQYRTAGKWSEPIKVPSIMDLFFSLNRRLRSSVR